jgi:hypothetical protein
MGKEVLVAYASDIAVEELAMGIDKNKSRLQINCRDKQFDMEFMGLQRRKDTLSVLQTGAKFDIIALAEAAERKECR